MKKPKEVIIETLKKAGFPISIHHGRNISPSSSSPSPCLSIHCDAVVVGWGSGGGVVAGVFAKGRYKVVVLEKGNYFARRSRSLSLLEFPTTDQMYEGSGLIATDNVGALFLADSTGSAVNWSGSIPTPAHVTDESSGKLGLEMFSSKAYQHALDAVCKRKEPEQRRREEAGHPRDVGHRRDAVNSGNAVILPRCKALKVLQWPEAEKKSYDAGIMTAMSTVVSNFDTSAYGCLIQTPALHPG
ncbi:hypothetical protein ACLOJK_026718 [Asimina triloba]